jgi:hypothetical protein
MVSGTLGGKEISDGRLRGDELTFTAGGAKQTLKVNSNTMKGSSWTASRK